MVEFEFDDTIQAAITKLAEARAAKIESVVADSLIDEQKRGVLVVQNLDGKFEVMLHESVPMGRIHYKADWTVGGVGD